MRAEVLHRGSVEHAVFRSRVHDFAHAIGHLSLDVQSCATYRFEPYGNTASTPYFNRT